MNAANWLRAASSEPWWRDHAALAIELVIMADASNGKPVVRTTSDMLAVRMRMSRTSLRRALDALQSAGFCVVVASKGRGGETAITICDQRPFDFAKQPSVTAASAPITTDGVGQIDSVAMAIIRPSNQGHLGHSESEPQNREIVCESLADLGDRGHFKADDLDIFRSSGVVDDAILGRSAPISRARDLDLLRSPDLRSSDLQDPTGSGETQIQVIAVEVEDEPAIKPRRPRVDPAKIPARAWLAADYLRGRVLADDPSAAVGRKPWSDTMTSGLRLAWANEFRLIHERDARPWDEIARVVHWLFNRQTGSARFVVQSPDSLREKWDRIQAQRRNQTQQEAQPKRGADGRPDPQAERRFKTLDPNNPWSDQ